MRRLLLVPALLSLAVVPSASACTIENCYETVVARGTAAGLTATCAVTGRFPQGFALVAEAHTNAPATAVSLRCYVTGRGTLSYDRTQQTQGPAAAFADTFTSKPDIVVCVEAAAGPATVSDCSA